MKMRRDTTSKQLKEKPIIIPVFDNFHIIHLNSNN